jgi:uncharacterized membrane protein YtjA (UPF0391 family)
MISEMGAYSRVRLFLLWKRVAPRNANADVQRVIPHRLALPFQGELAMLRLAIVFLVIALIAAFLGFGGVAALSWEGAKIIFVIFLVLAVLSFLGHGFRSRA